MPAVTWLVKGAELALVCVQNLSFRDLKPGRMDPVKILF